MCAPLRLCVESDKKYNQIWLCARRGGGGGGGRQVNKFKKKKKQRKKMKQKFKKMAILRWFFSSWEFRCSTPWNYSARNTQSYVFIIAGLKTACEATACLFFLALHISITIELRGVMVVENWHWRRNSISVPIVSSIMREDVPLTYLVECAWRNIVRLRQRATIGELVAFCSIANLIESIDTGRAFQM